MSEMEYNLDLARHLLKEFKLSVPTEFKGLGMLKIPESWQSPLKSPDVILVVSNSNSAQNAPLDRYLELAREHLSNDRSVDFLVSGFDASERRARLLELAEIKEGRMRVVEGFPRIAELIAYLAGANLVISSSTGPLHIAHAAGVNVVGFYPKSPKVQSFSRWRPHGYAHTARLEIIDI